MFLFRFFNNTSFLFSHLSSLRSHLRTYLFFFYTCSLPFPLSCFHFLLLCFHLFPSPSCSVFCAVESWPAPVFLAQVPSRRGRRYQTPLPHRIRRHSRSGTYVYAENLYNHVYETLLSCVGYYILHIDDWLPAYKLWGIVVCCEFVFCCRRRLWMSLTIAWRIWPLTSEMDSDWREAHRASYATPSHLPQSLL